MLSYHYKILPVELQKYKLSEMMEASVAISYASKKIEELNKKNDS